MKGQWNTIGYLPKTSKGNSRRKVKLSRPYPVAQTLMQILGLEPTAQV